MTSVSLSSWGPEAARREPYSYRHDPSVPDFPDDKPIIFIDGNCGLCSRVVRFVACHDIDGQIRFASIQIELGRAILAHYRMDANDASTWMLLEAGRASGSMKAVINVARKLSWPWPLFGRFVNLFPIHLQDWIYRRIARNRYRFFGLIDVCAQLPDELQCRVLR